MFTAELMVLQRKIEGHKLAQVVAKDFVRLEISLHL
jgi:hypothetical protein